MIARLRQNPRPLSAFILVALCLTLITARITARGRVSAAEPSKTSGTESPGAAASAPKAQLVYLVQHTHTDIGYTQPQAEIVPEHLHFIDLALDCCDQTDAYPDDAKFRWTCESLWVAREYLRSRPPAQVERFKRRVAEGRIEVAAMPMNMSEMATESSLAASLQAIREVRDGWGIPIRLAMQNDVNGAAWCLVDYFQDIGIKYLTMGINKTRSLLPFDKPTAFWWESPSGKRMLAFRAEHYMLGNTWGIHKGKLKDFETRLSNYLQSLEKRGYPFDRVSAQYSGSQTDNSAPSTVACDRVKTWNEAHKSPKLRIATASEFMDYVASHYANTLPVYRVAWPDWWTDGFGSAARETGQSRETHANMQATQGLLAMASINGQKLPAVVGSQTRRIQEGLLFYDEHTFGASGSVTRPMAENSMVQWEQKSSYVWDAVKLAGLLREEALGLLQDAFPRAEAPTLVVCNTLNWQRSGLFEVFIGNQDLPADCSLQIVDAETGEITPAQAIRKRPRRIRTRADGRYWLVWAKDVPPLGFKSYRIQPGDMNSAGKKSSQSASNVLDNAFYTITLDPQTGAVKSLLDKETGRELVDHTNPWHLGQLIYERLEGKRELRRDAFQRTTVRNVKLENGVDGPIYKSIRMQADLDGCLQPNGVSVEIRLYETEKRIELHFDIYKLPIVASEAVYVALPLQSPEGTMLYEAQGGLVVPGKDQLPGSASDWQTVQNFITVRDPQGQIILGSDQVPLVQLGDLNLGKWQPTTKVDQPHIYSWVMNNYWYTNFRASQEGEFRWCYYLTSTRDVSHARATRFGWGARVPLVPRVMSKGRASGQASASLLQGDVANLLLVESRPASDSRSIIMHWREVNGEPAVLDLSRQPFAKQVKAIQEVNVLEETIRQEISSISFAPYEVKFVKLIPSKR